MISLSERQTSSNATTRKTAIIDWSIFWKQRDWNIKSVTDYIFLPPPARAPSPIDNRSRHPQHHVNSIIKVSHTLTKLITITSRGFSFPTRVLTPVTTGRYHARLTFAVKLAMKLFNSSPIIRLYVARYKLRKPAIALQRYLSDCGAKSRRRRATLVSWRAWARRPGGKFDLHTSPLQSAFQSDFLSRKQNQTEKSDCDGEECDRLPALYMTALIIAVSFTQH